ncbi:hypothetical protein Tco_0105553 [Tanacetum coccineum]
MAGEDDQNINNQHQNHLPPNTTSPSHVSTIKLPFLRKVNMIMGYGKMEHTWLIQTILYGREREREKQGPPCLWFFTEDHLEDLHIIDAKGNEDFKALKTVDGDKVLIGPVIRRRKKIMFNGLQCSGHQNRGLFTSESQASESETQTSDFDTYDSNYSDETHESLPEPAVNEPKVVCQPKVWSDAPIIEEYESDSEDEHVSLPTEEQETPSKEKSLNETCYGNPLIFFGMKIEIGLPTVLNSPCFMVKSWLVQDQTVLGKDYSNLLIADSLLKTIWFINAPCYGNEALASPKENELTIPEQTATGKGKSNPFMADDHKDKACSQEVLRYNPQKLIQKKLEVVHDKEFNEANYLRPSRILNENFDHLDDYGSRIARPKIDDKDHFELKVQYLKEPQDNTFSGSDHEDANEHIEKVLETVDLFHIRNITQDQVMLRAFPMSLTGAASHWLRNKPSGSITTWEDPKTKFLSKYCPPA